MFKLYFSSVPSLVSTALIIGFSVFFGMVYSRRSQIEHWGILVLCLFFMGLLMSIMSGNRDKINAVGAVIPAHCWAMTVLSILGGLAFLAGLLMLIIRRQNFWEFGFYALSAIIIIKTAITEVYRIFVYFK